jgi:hypothetical protein
MGEGGSSGDPSDWDSAGEEGVFPLDHGDLDLEQIENNWRCSLSGIAVCSLGLAGRNRFPGILNIEV